MVTKPSPPAPLPKGAEPADAGSYCLSNRECRVELIVFPLPHEDSESNFQLTLLSPSGRGAVKKFGISGKHGARASNNSQGVARTARTIGGPAPPPREFFRSSRSSGLERDLIALRACALLVPT